MADNVVGTAASLHDGNVSPEIVRAFDSARTWVQVAAHDTAALSAVLRRRTGPTAVALTGAEYTGPVLVTGEFPVLLRGAAGHDASQPAMIAAPPPQRGQRYAPLSGAVPATPGDPAASPQGSPSRAGSKGGATLFPAVIVDVGGVLLLDGVVVRGGVHVLRGELLATASRLEAPPASDDAALGGAAAQARQGSAAVIALGPTTLHATQVVGGSVGVFCPAARQETVRLISCEVHSAHRAGVVVDGPGTFRLEATTITDCGAAGIVVGGTASGSIRGGAVAACAGCGLVAEGFASVCAVDTEFAACGVAAALALGHSSVTLQRCAAQHCLVAGAIAARHSTVELRRVSLLGATDDDVGRVAAAEAARTASAQELGHAEGQCRAGVVCCDASSASVVDAVLQRTVAGVVALDSAAAAVQGTSLTGIAVPVAAAPDAAVTHSGTTAGVVGADPGDAAPPEVQPVGDRLADLPGVVARAVGDWAPLTQPTQDGGGPGGAHAPKVGSAPRSSIPALAASASLPSSRPASAPSAAAVAASRAVAQRSPRAQHPSTARPAPVQERTTPTPHPPRAPGSRPATARAPMTREQMQRNAYPLGHPQRPATVSTVRPVLYVDRQGEVRIKGSGYSTAADGAVEEEGSQADDVVSVGGGGGQRSQVRLGHHVWNTALLPAFTQGKVSLAEVRVAADEKAAAARPSPRALSRRLHDDWMEDINRRAAAAAERDRRRREAEAEELAAAMAIDEDDGAHDTKPSERPVSRQPTLPAFRRRKLTPRQQAALNSRCYDEAVQRRRDGRAVLERQHLRDETTVGKKAPKVTEAERQKRIGEQLARQEEDRRQLWQRLRAQYLYGLQDRHAPASAPAPEPDHRMTATADAAVRDAHRRRALAQDLAERDASSVERDFKARHSNSARVVRSRRAVAAYSASLHTSHQDRQKAEAAEARAGLNLHFAQATARRKDELYAKYLPAPPRCRKSEHEITTYCASLTAAHKTEHLAMDAANVAGVKVGGQAPSPSRGAMPPVGSPRGRARNGPPTRR